MKNKQNMKVGLSVLIFGCIPFIMNAQECNNRVVFDAGDNSTYSISCGEMDESGWLVNRNSCNFYTPLTSLPDGEDGKGSWVYFNAKFGGSATLDEKDFVWIFFFVDGRTSHTKTVKGVPETENYIIHDSLFIPSGSNFRIRIAAVCDEIDEFWSLATGNLTLCTMGKNGNETPISLAAKDEITATKERDVVILKWMDEEESSGNYFKIERSGNGSKFEFAGFVKNKADAIPNLPYTFIDAGCIKPQTWYRISKVDFSGKETSFGKITTIKL